MGVEEMVSYINSYNFKGKNENKPNYAYIVKENPLNAVASSIQTHAENINNIRKAITKAEGSDYTLGRMNDTTIRMGSLGIASLASSMALSHVGGINEFLGFACWFASMGLSPKIINKMVQVKYGLDLDKEYVDSYGRRKKLFEDPGFICWDLMPKNEIDKIGDRMGIPKNLVNRREAIQEKITQVLIQSKTWMMISAGITTPVFASLIADTLKKPVNFLRTALHNKKMAAIPQKLEQAINTGNTDQAKKILTKAIESTFGENEAAALSTLWKEAPENLVKSISLDKAMKNKMYKWIPKVAGAAPVLTESQKFDLILAEINKNPQNAQKGVEVIEKSLQSMSSWKNQLLQLISNNPSLDTGGALKDFIEMRSMNFEVAFNTMKKTLADPKFLDGITDPQARRLSLEELSKIIGPDAARKFKDCVNQGLDEKAGKILSKRPFAFIDEALTENFLHSRWLKRIGMLGVAVLALTTLYTIFFIGKNNKYNPKINNN